PTLTARLQGLERELGAALFLRTSHGMRLTDAGRAWIPFAERALRALVDGRDALEQVMTASAGHLMIAAAPAVSTYVLPELLERDLGGALLPGTAVAREIAGKTLRAVKMKDAPPMQNVIVAYRRRDAGKPEGILAACLKLLEAR